MLHRATPHTLWGCARELASALTAAIILADASIGVDLTGILGEGTHGGTYYKSRAVEAK